jgi:hypothetical protein
MTPREIRRINEALMRVLRRRESYIDPGSRRVPTRIEGRNSDGTLLARPLDGECVERAAPCSAYPGQLVDRLCNAPLNMAGAAGIPLDSRDATSARSRSTTSSRASCRPASRSPSTSTVTDSCRSPSSTSSSIRQTTRR